MTTLGGRDVVIAARGLVKAYGGHRAVDAIDLVEIDYDPLPSVTSTADAAKPGAPAVWDEQPDNVCFVAELGNRAAVGCVPVAHYVGL